MAGRSCSLRNLVSNIPNRYSPASLASIMGRSEKVLAGSLASQKLLHRKLFLALLVCFLGSSAVKGQETVIMQGEGNRYRGINLNINGIWSLTPYLYQRNIIDNEWRRILIDPSNPDPSDWPTATEIRVPAPDRIDPPPKRPPGINRQEVIPDVYVGEFEAFEALARPEAPSSETKTYKPPTKIEVKSPCGLAVVELYKVRDYL